MSLSANAYDKPFIPLTPSENEQDAIVSRYTSEDQQKYFKYLKEHALFEIFRLEHHPKSYEEFGENKIAEIKNTKPVSSAVYHDSIALDKDYYYIIRAVNSHGLFSNPSPIYKIKQQKDADETFLNVEVVELNDVQETENSRKFQKLLQIIPSTLHTIYDTESQPYQIDQTSLVGKLDKVTLGIATDPIWGRTFKFRITSTDTGKKIDLNVTVNLTRNKTNEDS
jgi:hypothetical protein